MCLFYLMNVNTFLIDGELSAYFYSISFSIALKFSAMLNEEKYAYQ